MAEFDWWLLVVGLVVGGGLVYLVLADGSRREADLEAEELEAEASYLSERLAEQGLDLGQPEVAEVLREHRAYLSLPPPDAIVTAAPEPLETARSGVPGEAAETSRPQVRREPLPDGDTRA